jgi:hypothetical protein
VTASLQPLPPPAPEIRYQPSLRSIPSAAATVAPEERTGGAPEPPRTPRRKLWFFVALSAVAAVVGTAAAKRPTVSQDVRSGSPGFRKSSTGVDQHWKKRNVTVYLDASLQKLDPTAGEAVMQAFGSWVASDSKLPSLAFDTGSTSAQPIQDGKSTVSYAEIKTPGHEKDVAITVTYSNDKTGEILEADVVLNARYPIGVLKLKGTEPAPGTRDMQADDCQSRYDAQNVMTHEAGHFFGLGEDMVERSATMFLSIGQCELHKRVLATTDVGAVTTLYAQVEADEGSGGPKACSFGPAGAGTGAPILAALLGLSQLRRRRRR